MNAKELRIGNYVFIDNPEHWASIKNDIFYITGIKSFNNKHYPDSYYSFDLKPIKVSAKSFIQDPELHQIDKFVKPIPLTEKWLIKFGFKYNEYLGWCGDDENRRVFSLSSFHLSIEEDGLIYHWIDIDEDTCYSHKSKQFKYVHRLQNYYFECKDEELINTAEIKDECS